jgi:SAM-dependent methyltransferase
MDSVDAPNQAMRALWNGTAGRGWVEAQDALRAKFAAVTERLLAGIPAGDGGRLLDVGCGSGATTLAMARRLGPGADCLGVDVSEPLLEVARAHAAEAGLPVRFLQADAQVHEFEPAGFDWLVSQFGVMFFDDPVRAFENLRRAARPGAALRLAAWRTPAENGFMTLAERTATPLLPALQGQPARPTGAPGQYAFADPDLVRRILASAGWTGIDVRPADVACAFPASELERYLSWIGAVGRLLQEVDGPSRRRVLDALLAAHAAYVHGAGGSDATVRFTAACWVIVARAP